MLLECYRCSYGFGVPAAGVVQVALVLGSVMVVIVVVASVLLVPMCRR